MGHFLLFEEDSAHAFSQADTILRELTQKNHRSDYHRKDGRFPLARIDSHTALSSTEPH
jgi:hypothetical protein